MLPTRSKMLAAVVLTTSLAGMGSAEGAKAPAGVKAKEADKGKVEPAGTPLAARLVAKKDTYVLDRGGKTAEEYAKHVEEAAKSGRVVPAPMVDLVLELRNTGDKEIKIWVGGDATKLLLDLNGPGVVRAVPRLAFTLEFRGPTEVTLAPGKTHSLPIARLSFGHRNASNLAYWTRAGDYTLSATYQTAVSPAPEKSQKVDAGFGRVAVTSSSVKLKVKDKE